MPAPSQPVFSAVIDATSHPPRVLVRGEVDMATASEFERCLSDASAGGPPLAIDLSRVTFMDSSGLTVLVRTAERFGFAPGTIQLLEPSDPVRQVLEVTGVGELLTVVTRTEI
ncbi:MAG: STAS domain-containing protein [Acidimicrobiales bacterium]